MRSIPSISFKAWQIAFIVAPAVCAVTAVPMAISGPLQLRGADIPLFLSMPIESSLAIVSFVAMLIGISLLLFYGLFRALKQSEKVKLRYLMLPIWGVMVFAVAFSIELVHMY